MCGQGMKIWVLHKFWCKNLLEIDNLEDKRRDGMVIFKKGFCRNGLCRWNVMKMAQDHVTQWQELLLLKGEVVRSLLF
jgi:hypothetical protein